MKTCCLVVFTFLISSFILINGLDSSVETIAKEASKLEEAKKIFDNIKDSNFVKTVQSVSKWGLPLLESVSFFSKVIMAQFEGESKELKFMKEKFKEINEKMDNVDQEFIEVKRAIDWNVVKVQYSSHEMAIDVLQDLINNIANSPVNVRRMTVDIFISTFNQIYSNACNKIYESFINQHRVFSTNLIEAVRHYTENHLYKIQQFFTGNINLILKGLQIEVFYLNAKNLSSSNEIWTNQWNSNLQNLMSIMKSTSDHIKQNYLSQLELDLEKFNVQNYQLSNKEYSLQFYNYLSEKYRWREWFVVIYNPIFSGENHFVSTTGGFIKFRLRGHNIVVGSRDKNSIPMDVAAIQRILNNLPRNLFVPNKGLAEVLLVDKLIPELEANKLDWSLAAVIEYGAGVWYISGDNYQVYKKYEGLRTYNIIVMG